MNEGIDNQQPQEQHPTPNPYYTALQEERVSSFLNQTSPSKSLKNIDYILRGYIYDAEQNQYVKVSDGIPDDVRLDFIQMLTPHLSEDVRMTNLDKNQINGIMAFVIEWVVDYLDNIADEKNLEEPQMTKIGLILVEAVYYTILRASFGIENRRVFGSLSMGENISPQQRKEGKEWWKIWKQ